MSSRRVTPDKIAEAKRLIAEHGGVRPAARASGIPRKTLSYRASLDAGTLAAMEAVGTDLVPSVIWHKTENEDGTSYSVMTRPEAPEFPSFLEQIRETIDDLGGEMKHDLPERFDDRDGNLLVLDPADVHIGKLCVESETGVRYDTAIAEHRLVEGCRALIDRGVKNGCTSVLLVIGNDIAHIDKPNSTTTSGTPQDSDGTIFTIHRAAQAAYVRVVT